MRCCLAPNDAAAESACCAGAGATARCCGDSLPGGWVTGLIETIAGNVPRVATRLDCADRFGALAVRFGLGRMRYAIEPGLYAVGAPEPASPVFVSANYKLSFDRLREELDGIDGWILVLDTKGINVWCSAGAGTFGTAEIVRRIEASGLADIVSHRRLILPQLSAPGVAAHDVLRQSGFAVVYGPVRACDIPAFLSAGMKANPAMRRVHFRLADRAALVPVETLLWARLALPLALVLALLSGLGRDGYLVSRAAQQGPATVIMVVVAWLVGCAAVPLLLPWVPGRAFSLKGAFAGVLVFLVTLLVLWPSGTAAGRMDAVAWLVLGPALSSFLAMNFTGASTYTSLSGVHREMRLALPVQSGAALIGLVLWLAARFVV